MTAKDKLAVGLTMLVIFFAIALMAVPVRTYHTYFAELRRRKFGMLIKGLLALAFLLALPYFYDELVGFSSSRVSAFLQIAMGACAYVVLIDIAWFGYRQIRASSPPR